MLTGNGTILSLLPLPPFMINIFRLESTALIRKFINSPLRNPHAYIKAMADLCFVFRIDLNNFSTSETEKTSGKLIPRLGRPISLVTNSFLITEL